MGILHLTNDNGAVIHADESGENHLAGITDTASHLVVIEQKTDWNDKSFVVTPSEKKFVWVDAWGVETWPTTQGGKYVMDDTNAIVSLAETRLAASVWQTGDKPLFSLFTRAFDPNRLYTMTYTSDAQRYAGVCRSAVALKFNFRHLHASLLTSFRAYLRCYIPSLLNSDPMLGAGFAVMFNGSWYNNASKLRARFVRDLPENAGSIIADDALSLELSGNCNNGTVVTSDTVTSNCINYDPYDQFHHEATYCQFVPFRVYATDRGNPASFYHDFEITGAQLDFLKTNPGTAWLLARFNTGNAIAAATAGSGLNTGLASTAFIQRIEIVLKCTGKKIVET